MNTVVKRIAWLFLLWGLVLTPAASRAADRDGMHDFDWDIGTWKVHQRRLLHPLSGSTSWVEYDGTDAVQKIFDGANMGNASITPTRTNGTSTSSIAGVR